MRSFAVSLFLVSYLAGPRPGDDAPRVVKAAPDDGATAVDPALRELRVTFDRDMDTRGMSIVGGGPTFPADPAGKARWVDARTNVLPLRLGPNQSYQLSINSARFQNFRDTRGKAAVPYPIRFRTAVKSGVVEEVLSEAANRAALDRLRQAIDEDYSYRDLRQVDWAKAMSEAMPGLLKARTPLEFAQRAAAMLAPARDLHLSLRAGDWQVPTCDLPVVSNFDRGALAQDLPGLDLAGPVSVGRLDDGTTYIGIASWSPDVAPRLDAVYRAIAEADPKRGLVLDVRANGGGSELLAREVAGCFVDGPVVYAKHVTRARGAFSAVQERRVGPSAGRPSYRGPVAVLIGPVTMSSCESFIRMMKRSPGCVLVGDRTRGSSGNPQPVDLGNGVTALVPSWRDLDLDGRCVEGEGVAPDVLVKVGPRDFQSGDPVLREARKRLRSPRPGP